MIFIAKISVIYGKLPPLPQQLSCSDAFPPVPPVLHFWFHSSCFLQSYTINFIKDQNSSKHSVKNYLNHN